MTGAEAIALAKTRGVVLAVFLDKTGALVGADLLARLAELGFHVRRYGDQAALDDDKGQGRVPPIPLLCEFADRQREYSAALRGLTLEGSSVGRNDHDD
jgi:hypothetical protein